MSINPASDIVLDVARAADRSRSLAAMERLLGAGAAQPASGAFASLMTPPAAGAGDFRSEVAMMAGKPAASAAPAAGRGASAYKGLEELVLQRLVETMLPKEASGVFGAGTAGDIWRSMLAEQLARQISKSVDFGLANSGAARIAASAANADEAVAPAGASTPQRS